MNKKIIIFVIVFWIVIATVYLQRNERPQRCMDFWGHVKYTAVIINEKRLPKPFEGWQTYQPPLYYLINSTIAPEAFKKDIVVHIRYVEYLSVFYGVCVLLAIGWLLEKFNVSSKVLLLVLLFIASTPKFTFIFSSYNNDSLATLLSVLIVVLSYKLYLGWSRKIAVLLFLFTCCGVYTKFTSFIAIFAVFIVCCLDILENKPTGAHQKKIIKILLIASLLYLPYAHFHNFKHSGEYLPSNFSGIAAQAGLHLPKDKSILNIVLPTSVFEIRPHKWDDPFHHSWSTKQSTKKSDYWSSSFINSIFGESSFKTPEVVFVWLLLFIHLFIRVSGIRQIFVSNINKVFGLLILIAHLGQIAFIFQAPYAPSMDYRYIAWTWLPWSYLYAKALSENSTWSRVLEKVIVAAILIQTFILFTIGEEFR